MIEMLLFIWYNTKTFGSRRYILGVRVHVDKSNLQVVKSIAYVHNFIFRIKLSESNVFALYKLALERCVARYVGLLDIRATPFEFL